MSDRKEQYEQFYSLLCGKQGANAKIQESPPEQNIWLNEDVKMYLDLPYILGKECTVVIHPSQGKSDFSF